MADSATPEAPREPTLAGRLRRVREEIASACRDAGRADAPELIVVTKWHPAQMVRELHDLGERAFGESRYPESRNKRAEAGELEGACWHFIGQIQTNKAKHIVRSADVIHSIDRPELVSALSAAVSRAEIERDPIDALIQLNLTDDAGRGGCEPGNIEHLAELVASAPGLRLRGVMAVAPLGGDPHGAFATVAAASEAIARIDPAARWRSAGMSGDFRAAIASGATHLRIGTAITGNRPSRA